MPKHSNETVWPALIFFATWWAFTQYPALEPYGFFGALALWFVGMIAVRMFSSTVHQRGFWGWVLLLELAAWYALALWLVPLEPVTKILLLWGVATPLLFVGNVWRRAYDRFPPIQGVMCGALWLFLFAGVSTLPVFAWHMGPAFFLQLALATGSAAAGGVCLYYGWRLAAPPGSGHYDARLGTVDSFRRRGMSDER